MTVKDMLELHHVNLSCVATQGSQRTERQYASNRDSSRTKWSAASMDVLRPPTCSCCDGHGFGGQAPNAPVGAPNAYLIL
eukprot:3140995-Pleurochrysis_carterae.AAC.5